MALTDTIYEKVRPSLFPAAIRFALKPERRRRGGAVIYVITVFVGRGEHSLFFVKFRLTKQDLLLTNPRRVVRLDQVRRMNLSVHGRAGGRSTVREQCSGIGSDSTKVECLVEGPIRIPPLFPFPSAPFPRNEKEDGTLELYYLSAYCLPKILLLQLVGHRVIQISRVFRGFPMLQLLYQFGRSGMDRLNIPLGRLVLTFLCGIHSRSALGITSSSGGNSSQNPTTSPTSLPPTLSRTSIETEWFHVLSSIGYSFPFVSLSPI
ncbi:hypothetical protein L2E82_48976 [Cichorium intybus]|uniref:Uncharacterized protein n=1 Tax=Cichorium intybus TaxID=13427 RepID=A0ACB8YZF2_CICIN|nr:hypothetical protein L2E82_48976 [Cichorium intybus]